MDDKGTMCMATDCASTESEMKTSDHQCFANIPESLEFDPSPIDDPSELPFDIAAEMPSDDEDCAIQTPPADKAASATEADQRDILAGQVVEALLFSSDAPLSANRLADMVGECTPGVVRKHIEALNDKYARAALTFRIEEIARGYQMMTLPDYKEWIAKLNKHRSETRLSGAALEALSIIAYKQPVIRADVEAIRGVACGEVISRLREMGMVRILGRAEIVGRPLLYGTTKKFLDVFGLADLDDLPPMEALKLKSASKPIEEVEPVKPPPIPAPPREQIAVAGA